MLQFQFPCCYSSLPYSSQIGNHITPATNPIPPSQFLQSQILCSAHISQTIEHIIQIQTYPAYYKSHLLSPHIIAHYLQPKHSPLSLQPPAHTVTVSEPIHFSSASSLPTTISSAQTHHHRTSINWSESQPQPCRHDPNSSSRTPALLLTISYLLLSLSP